VQEDATFEGRQSFFNIDINGLRLFTCPPPFFYQGFSPVARSFATDMEDTSYSTPWITRRGAGYPRSANFNPTFELLRKHTLHADFGPARAGRVPGLTERYLNLSAAIEPVTQTSEKPARKISQRPDSSKASHRRLRRSGRLSVNTSRRAGTFTGGPIYLSARTILNSAQEARSTKRPTFQKPPNMACGDQDHPYQHLSIFLELEAFLK